MSEDKLDESYSVKLSFDEIEENVGKQKEKEQLEQREKQKEISENWDKLSSEEKILDTLLNIKKTLNSIEQNQNRKLEGLRNEISNRSVQINDKLSNLKWAALAIAIMIYVTFRMGL